MDFLINVAGTTRQLLGKDNIRSIPHTIHINKLHTDQGTKCIKEKLDRK